MDEEDFVFDLDNIFQNESYRMIDVITMENVDLQDEEYDDIDIFSETDPT